MQPQFSILPGVILSRLPSGIVVLSAEDMTLRYANPAFKRHFLPEGTAFDLARFSARFTSAPAQEIAENVKRTARDGQPRSLYELETDSACELPSPSYWNIDCVPVCLIDRRVDAVVLICQNVTEQVAHRHRAEQRARQAEARERLLEAVVRNVPEGLIVAEGQDLIIRHISNLGAKMAGSTVDELIGKSLHTQLEDWRILDPDTGKLIPKERQPLVEAVQKGRIITDREIKVRAPNGRQYWVTCNAGPVRDERGKITAGILAWRDISALKRTERALHETEARFRLAQELSLDGFILLRSVRDASGAIVDFQIDYANPVVQRLLGILPAERRTLSAVLSHTEGYAELFRHLRRVVETGRAVEFELRRTDRDANVRWFRHVVVKMDDDGVAASFTEITALKKAEHKARDHAARLKLALETAPVMLLFRDRDLRMTWCSQPPAQIPSAPQVLGSVPEDVYLPAEAAAIRALYSAVLETGHSARQLLQLTADHFRGKRWFDITAQPLRDAQGEITGIASAVYDVTELVEVRNALSQREEWLRLALRAAAMGAWELDIGNKLLRHTESLRPLFGLPPANGPTPLETFAQRLLPEDAERVLREFECARESNSDEIQTEFRVVDLDGSQRWLRLLGRIERDEHGNVQKILGVTLDVSAAKRTLDSLERSNAELQRFAAAVAHDLKTPLQSVVGFGQLLARAAGTRLAESERDYLDHILEASRQMNELIDNLLDYAYASHIDRPTAPVDLEAVLAELLKRLNVPIQEARATITHDPLPVVPGHRPLLAQALQNLIVNALKFRRGLPHIHISAEPSGDGWIISVRDNGIGIRPEDQPYIFEPFRRSHGMYYSGHGLGLAVVKNVAERHGGRVWVSSRPGEGTTFFIYLPCNTTPTATTTAAVGEISAV